MTNAPILTSRNIGETENALRAILIRTLTDTGLDYPRWVALKVVNEEASQITVAELATLLKGGLKLDDATARAVIDDLQRRHILDAVGENLSPTQDGVSLYRRLTDDIQRVSVQIYAGLEREDLVTAHRVLSTILERANAVLMN